MTVQEAIEILRDTPIDIRSTREDDIHTLYATAQGMAIEALSKSKRDLSEDTIYRQDAIDAIWKALYEYEDKTEKQFQESDELDVSEWIMNDRMWVQNGHNLCVDVLTKLPSAQPEIIRCKDCWHYPSEYADCPMIGWARNENDFCSKAERRTDEIN